MVTTPAIAPVNAALEWDAVIGPAVPAPATPTGISQPSAVPPPVATVTGTPAVDAGAVLLSCLLLADPGLQADILSAVEPRDFTDAWHRGLWAKARALAGDGKRVDLVTLSAGMDGPQCADLARLAASAATAYVWESAAAAVRTQASRRRMLEALERAESRIARGDPAEVATELVESFRAETDAGGGRTAAFLDAAEWLAEPPPDEDAVLDGVFEAGDKVLVVGASKAGKTWLSLHLAVCLAAGKPWLGFGVPRPRRVAVVQLELKPTHYQRRCSRVLGLHGLAPADVAGQLLILNGRGAASPVRDCALPALVRQLKAAAVDVLVLDPVYKLLDGDENAAGDVKPLLLAFDRIATETGAAVVYVHHAPKGQAGDRQAIDRGAGSGVLARDFDAGIFLTAHETQGLWVLEVVPRNHVQPDPVTVERTPDCNFVVRPELPAEVRTSRTARAGLTIAECQARAADALKPGEHLTVNQLKERLTGVGVPQAKRTATINAMEKAKRWEWAPGPNRSRRYSVVVVL